MSQILVLCSGGLKSAFMTSVAIREGGAYLLFINHGQDNFAYEHRAVIRLAEYFKVPLVLQYKRPKNVETEPLLNIITMLALALPIARKLHCGTIYYGLSKDDLKRTSELASLERTESFLKSINLLFLNIQAKYDGKGGYLGQVEIEFPLFKLHEHHVVRLGNEYGTPWHLTWACEDVLPGKGIHCGICLKCMRRQLAFRTEGKCVDPTLYTMPIKKRI